MDLIAGFIDQCIVIDYEHGDKVMASDLFSVYSAWAKKNNEWEMSSKRFFMELAKKVPEKGRSGKGIFYASIRLSDYAHSLVPKQYRMEDIK